MDWILYRSIGRTRNTHLIPYLMEEEMQKLTHTQDIELIHNS